MITDRRAFFRQGLNDLYLPLYDRLCQLLGPEWKPYSGYRTFEAQQNTFANGRVQAADGSWTIICEGKVETNAQGGESPHNYGCATDWTYFDGPEHDHLEWIKRDDPRWKEYGEAVTLSKLKWGGEFHRPDPGHNELHIAIDWRDVHKQFLGGGRGAANAAIYAAMMGGTP